MAKRKQEEPPKGAPAWTSTFGDLMNLLLCFFVMLFSMSTMDAQKVELLAASFNQTFSIFSAGASAIGDGLLISNGVSQLNELDNYINSTGRDAEGNVIPDDLGSKSGGRKYRREAGNHCESRKRRILCTDRRRTFKGSGTSNSWKEENGGRCILTRLSDRSWE